MNVFTVTIGRNVNNVPMSDKDWAQFQGYVEQYLADALTTSLDGTIETHLGKGEWDGIEEESAKITVLRHFPITDDQEHALTRYLSTLARAYDQEAIALTIGRSELIYA